MKRLGAVGLDDRAQKAGLEATQQAILAAVAQNAPEGSPIRMVAQIFQAGIVGQQQARKMAETATRKHILTEAMETNELRAGAAGLLELGDADGAKFLLDRWDAEQEQITARAKQALDEARFDLERDDALTDNERANRKQQLDELKHQLDVRERDHVEQRDNARTGIQDRNSRFKVINTEDGPVTVDVVGGGSRPGAREGAQDATAESLAEKYKVKLRR